MKLLATKNITAQFVLEHSSTSVPQPLGTHASEMNLYAHERHNQGGIEWDIPALEEVVYIGLWWDEDMNLTDYDGVFQLADEVIEFLEENGFTVGEDFR